MNLKRILSFLVSVIMILSVVTTAAFANEFENEEDISDVYEIISAGIGNAENYIQEQLVSAHNGGGVTYGFEWDIITMLRAGKTVDVEILDEYYASVEEEVNKWTSAVKPTDAERTALTFVAMGKDITDFNGINLAELIYNNSRLADGSNELAYALIALDAADVEIPDDALYSRERIIDSILELQTADGGFGLTDNVSTDVDMTAICIQALSPYQDKETVKDAIDKALVYLKKAISEDYTYSNNVNSAAQVLMAAASLKIDVTNPENGFGDENNNIISAIERYRNPDGNGYMYGDMVSPMATFQVMQAYDAYRKAHKEDLSYWNFSDKGDENNDNEDEPIVPDVESAEPVTVYVTIASEGNIVKDKNDAYVAQVPVTVTDLDSNGTLTVDEALYIAHEEYYDGGAEAGYNTFAGTYGLSLGVLWGNGTPGTSAVAGYWLDNVSCWSLNDEVSEGDYLTAFNYYDKAYCSDRYSYFDTNEVTVKSGSTVILTLNAIGYDESWNTVSQPYHNAKVKFLDSEISQDEMTTDENGQVEIKLKDISAGEYYVIAYSVNSSIVPAVCKINVIKNTVTTAPSSSTGGGNKLKVEVKNDKEKKDIDNITEEDEKTVTEENASIVFTENTFPDVNKEDWYYDSVKYVYENSLMQGTKNGFEPGSKMSRAMLVTVLCRMANPEEITGNHSFQDVATGQWYSDAVTWAATNGIVNGISETEFKPDSEVSREQMAVIIYRFAKMQGYDVSDKQNISDFEDYDNISDWAIDAIRWANKAEIISGTSETTLSPKNASTRAQVATMLMRFCKNNDLQK